jgi:hypothetical protein
MSKSGFFSMDGCRGLLIPVHIWLIFCLHSKLNIFSCSYPQLTGTTDTAGDGIEQQLLVEPRGRPVYVNKAVFIDLREETDETSIVQIVTPAVFEQGSLKSEVTVYGDIIGASIDNSDYLIR